MASVNKERNLNGNAIPVSSFDSRNSFTQFIYRPLNVRPQYGGAEAGCWSRTNQNRHYQALKHIATPHNLHDASDSRRDVRPGVAPKCGQGKGEVCPRCDSHPSVTSPRADLRRATTKRPQPKAPNLERAAYKETPQASDSSGAFGFGVRAEYCRKQPTF